ncbi:MAG: helix-turn-helix domain-containing protein [Actinomycetota bacterium]
MQDNRKDLADTRRLFDGDRLRLARELRGYTQAYVGRQAGISGAAVSQFEQGHARPTTDTLPHLARALGFPIRFFAKDLVETEGGSPAFFRSLRATSATARRQARAFAELVRQFTLALEKRVDLPDHEIPELTIRTAEDRQRVEATAGKVREQWNIREFDPVENMVASLERHGAITVRVTFDIEGMDAFSVPYRDRPVVILVADKSKKDRSRFDAAHELGHLVMHRSADATTKQMEKQAHQFAAAFLMPAEAIYDELPSIADWELLLVLKKKWATSMGSLLYRARTLGKMKEEVYVRATRAMSSRGWRVHEPGDLGAPESPAVLRRAFDLVREEGLSTEDLALEAGLPEDQVRRILDAAAPTRQSVRI